MRFCLGTTCLLIAGIVATVVTEDFCTERCCSWANTTQLNSTAAEARSTDNTSSCIQKCRLSQKAGLKNISDEQLCGQQIKNDTRHTNNTTGIKDGAHDCDQMFKEEATNDFVGIVKGIRVIFYKMTGNRTYYYVNITWNPFNATDPSKNWTNYAILWRTEYGDPHYCYLVPKDQTFFLINSSLWKYPYALELNVTTYPLKKLIKAGYQLRISARPKIKLPFVDNPFPTADPSVLSSALLVTIIVGSCVGFALFIAVVVAWKLRVRVHNSQNIFLRYLESLGRNRKKELSKTNSEMTVVEDIAKCYLSYFHEDDQYIATVLAVVKDLSLLGYKIILNKMYSEEMREEGADRWAQNQITNSSKIIVLCSPSYIKICQKGASAICNNSNCEWNRVWFEIQMIGNIYKKRRSASKIICLWMNKDVPEGLPPWMDLMYTWPQDLEKIIHRLKKHPSRRSTNRDSRYSTPSTQYNINLSINDEDEDDNVFT